MKPKIYVDTREQNLNILNCLLASGTRIEIGMKSGGPGDYIIVDAENNNWGIEYKTFNDCYSSIIERDADGKTGRIYGQLAELKQMYGHRAILFLEEFRGLPKVLRPKQAQIKQAVYTFFSERSFALITCMVRDDEHMAYLLLKLANRLPNLHFEGRGYGVTVK